MTRTATFDRLADDAPCLRFDCGLPLDRHTQSLIGGVWTLACPPSPRRYRLTTTRGNVYLLDGEGYVLSRSNGPAGWDYGKGWRIVSLSTRYHSLLTTPIAAAAEHGIPGWGVIRDWDHGAYRVWGGERCRSLEVVA